jgi:hypothetical protein
MIARYDIIQRTDEWHEVKWAKIGGTRSGVTEKTLLPEIIAELTEPFYGGDEGFTSHAMQRGIDLEPMARERLEAELFIEFNECGWLQSESNDLLGISPDGISADETIMCEIKCPSGKKHMETILNGDILPEYIDQLIHAFVVNDKLEKHYFVSFRPENTIKPLWIKELTLDSEVNIGTFAKPVIVTVKEAVKKKLIEWELFQEKALELIEGLK